MASPITIPAARFEVYAQYQEKQLALRVPRKVGKWASYKTDDYLTI